MGWLWQQLQAEPLYLPAAALAAVFLYKYVRHCHKQKTPFDLAAACAGVLSCGGLVAGVLMIVSTFVPELQAKLTSFKLYTLIGGVAVVAVTIRSILGHFKPK
jgi:hypothetical protein